MQSAFADLLFVTRDTSSVVWSIIRLVADDPVVDCLLWASHGALICYVNDSHRHTRQIHEWDSSLTQITQIKSVLMNLTSVRSRANTSSTLSTTVL